MNSIQRAAAATGHRRVLRHQLETSEELRLATAFTKRECIAKFPLTANGVLRSFKRVCHGHSSDGIASNSRYKCIDIQCAIPNRPNRLLLRPKETMLVLSMAFATLAGRPSAKPAGRPSVRAIGSHFCQHRDDSQRTARGTAEFAENFERALNQFMRDGQAMARRASRRRLELPYRSSSTRGGNGGEENGAETSECEPRCQAAPPLPTDAGRI